MLTCSVHYVSLSAMIFLEQTTLQSWPPKPAADWASFLMQGLSLLGKSELLTSHKAFIHSLERGSALRSAPFLAPPPFWKLPKRGVPHSRPRHTAVHQSGASRPTPPLSPSLEKQEGKIRVPLGTPLVSFRVRRCSMRLVVCVEVGCVLGVAVWMAWLLRCGCGDVGCSKITTGKSNLASKASHWASSIMQGPSSAHLSS